MKRELILREGYVLRVSPYKEADAMVTCFTKDGLISFLARGIRKLTSKNASSCQILSYSRFSLAATADQKSLTLQEGMLLKSTPEKEDLLWMACVSFLAEINARLLTEEDAPSIFPFFAKAMEGIENGYPIYSSCLLYFAKLLSLLGYGLEVDNCVLCNEKKDIVGISYENGGFVCAHCADETTYRLGARMLKVIRYAFRYPIEDFGRVAFEKEESLFLIQQFARYAEDLTGVHLKSVSLLEKC